MLCTQMFVLILVCPMVEIVWNNAGSYVRQ